MGLWQNTAYVQTEDLGRLEAVLRKLVAMRGRSVVEPLPRTPEEYDSMQYGKSDEVWRWGFAGFRGGPGWSVLRTAPYELLQHGDTPLIGELARELGTTVFQYNVYDGDSDVLFEADARGAVERCGFDGSDPTEFWGSAGPPEDRCGIRFRIVDVEDAAAAAEARSPDAQAVGLYFGAPEPLEEWLSRAGGTYDEQPYRLAGRRLFVWRAHPAAVVRELCRESRILLSIEDAVPASLAQVFGGDRAEYCDNQFVLEVLVPHAPMPVDGFVLYADRHVDR